MLTDFDYAVIEYAQQKHVRSETIYAMLDKRHTKYRDQYTEEQLMEFLNSLKIEIGNRCIAEHNI